MISISSAERSFGITSKAFPDALSSGRGMAAGVGGGAPAYVEAATLASAERLDWPFAWCNMNMPMAIAATVAARSAWSRLTSDIIVLFLKVRKLLTGIVVPAGAF
jgi:hypothetical protein